MQFKLEILFNTFNELDEFVGVYKKKILGLKLKQLRQLRSEDAKHQSYTKRQRNIKNYILKWLIVNA